MKGKSHFTIEEIKQITALIERKISAPPAEQKVIRAAIRKLGFYASDYAIGGGYTVEDFFRVVGSKSSRAQGKKPTQGRIKHDTVLKEPRVQSNPHRKKSDECYILDLCDEVLRAKANRQHRFSFLKGDTGRLLPVDAFYPELNMVVEYMERQHTEKVNFFDKRQTASGISRGEQRKRYDQLRQSELRNNKIALVVFHFHEFPHMSNKRLKRIRDKDISIVAEKLNRT